MKPNILFMIADDHRYDAIRAFGDETVRTPVLDRLAAGGASFLRNHMMGGLSGAVCVPARSCLHTGVNVFRASAKLDMGDMDALMTLNPEVAHLPRTLRDAGYYTFATGKWHNDKKSFAEGFCGGDSLFFGGMSDHDRVPVHRFDPDGVYAPEDRYWGDKFSTDLFSDSAIRFLENYNADQPFFLYLAYTAPHDPRTAPSAYAGLYDPATIPIPPNFMEEHPFDNGELLVRDEKLEEWPRAAGKIQRHLADYYAMISHMDDRIGSVLQALERTGHAENTVIVYTADHGLALGQHGLLGKQNVYDHSIRIPLILNGPGIPEGRRVEELTCTYDLFPTLCEIADIPIPASVESSSLLPLLRGETDRHYDYVVSIYKDLQRAVSDGEWKYIRYYRSQERRTGTDHVQLFHLSEDPWELHNLAEEAGSRGHAERLAGILADWQHRVSDPLTGR